MNLAAASSYLSKKKILVTGGSGFIGSHLVRRLVSYGAEVAITTKYNSAVDNIRVVDLWDDLRIIEVDFRNLDSSLQIKDFKPDVIFHLAAYNHGGDSFIHQAEAMDSNAKGTVNLLQAYDGYERFVYMSTSEVYGFQQEVPFVETMRPSPISPYSIGKYSGELFAQMLMGQMAMPITVVRPFNAFGPYQSTRAVIAEMILTCLAGNEIKSTQGKQTREFNFVHNLVDGIVLAASTQEAIGKVLNLGSGREIAIRDLIQMIHRETGSSSELKIGALEDRPTEIWRMCADSTKARDILGWEPRIEFEEGLRSTIEWYRCYVKEFAPGSGLHALASF